MLFRESGIIQDHSRFHCIAIAEESLALRIEADRSRAPTWVLKCLAVLSPCPARGAALLTIDAILAAML